MTLTELKAAYLATHWQNCDEGARHHLTQFCAFLEASVAKEMAEYMASNGFAQGDDAPAPTQEEIDAAQAEADRQAAELEAAANLAALCETGKPADAPTDSGQPDPDAAPLEVKTYADGTEVTGTAPLPELSPAESDAAAAAGRV